MATVCLLSPAPVWVNPRLRKEADALYEAGYDVVVGYRADGDVDRDDAILAAKPWRWQRIDLARSRNTVGWLRAALREKLAEWLVRRGIGARRLAPAAYCRGDRELLGWAIAQKADLYIAHTQPALAIAGAAASHWGVPFAFDCEDLLAEEMADGGRAPWRRRMIVSLEREYLPRAAYVSATSDPMAGYLRDQYALERIPVWHNCFPAAETAALLPPEERVVPSPVQLAWMSATIGPGRGLEDIFAALGQVGPIGVLHLYGETPPQYRSWLGSQLAPLRGRVMVAVHPIPGADDVMKVLAQHQIGLTLDLNDCLNRSLTVCNKVFLYLQAGLACVATDTPGQRSVIPPGAAYGAVYPPGDVMALVAILRRLTDGAALQVAQRAAWDVGRARFVWDAERPHLLDAVAAALGTGRQRGDVQR